MKKRLLSALMVFCMVLTLLPVSAFAAGSNETVDRIRLMDKSDWETATIARAGYDTDDVSWATVTSIRFLTEDGSYTNSDVVPEYDPDCYSNEGYFADNPGQKIPPSEIDRVVVTLNYAHAGWNVGKIEYGVRAVFHREDFNLAYTEGDLGVREYAELTLKDNAASVGDCAVTFMYKPIGATNWSIYDILYVDEGTSLGENMPANPATGTQHFVGWNTSKDGIGDYFDANTEVNEDITVYGIKVTAGGATAYHVMNGSENWLKQEVLDRDNNETSTIDQVNIYTIQVNGAKEDTNPIYWNNGWREYNGVAENHWYIYNIDFFSPIDRDWNRDVPLEDITGITLTGTIGTDPFKIMIPRGDLEFKTVTGAGVDVIVEIWLTEALEDSTTTYPVIGTIDNDGTVENGNQNVERGKASQAMVFKPADGYEITGVAVNGSSIDEFQVDAEGSYTYPAQSSVTQEITVTVTTTAKKPSYEGYTIQVSFCRPDDQAPITIPQTVTSGQSAIPPVKDGNKTITGWKLDSVDGALYSGTYDFNSLATLVTEKDGWNNHDQQGYLTFYAIYGEPEPAQRTAQVNFIINASDDHGSYENGLKEVPYTWTDMSSMITPPTVVCDEGYEHVGWVLNGATTTEMTVPNIQVDPNLAYFAEGETTGYLTVYPVFKAVEAPQRTAQVNFIINASDDHGSYENGLKEVPYTWTDMSSMITPPTVVCDEGYEHVGWVLNGATTTEMTVPNIQVDPNLAYFAEGETTGYLTVYPVFKAVEAETKSVGLNYWDVVNNVQVAEGSLTVAADATNVNTSTFTDIPEGYELVWTGDLPIVDGWVWVEVRPVEDPDPATQSVTVTYWDTENDQQVGESFTITVDADATYVNTSSFTDIPAGYELAWTGDLPIVDGAVRVELRPIEESVPATYTITASAENGGSISPNGTTTVNEGDDLTFTIRANSNYDIDEVYVDGKSVGSVSRYTFSDVSEDHTIRATFTRESSGGGSGGSGSSGGGSDSDSTGNLTISLDVTGGSDEFTFTVTFTDEDDDELNNKFHYNGDSSGRIGSGDEITLADGDEIVIRNLPEGTRYEVAIETVEGYTYSATGEEGTIRTRGNEAEFTVSPVAVAADPSVTGVADWLNTSDHIAYLTGYPGGNFGPDSSMTRAEVAQMFYALLNNKNVTITKTFADVPSDAWYATAVNTLGTLGMVTGDSNGNFRPNDPITRAEFCVIALAFAYEPEDYSCSFYDVSRSDWFYPYVAQASTYGWIGGYTSGNFGPNDQITRAQVTTIVNNMLGREADQDYVADHQDDLVQFNDLSQSHWAYYDVMEAVNAHDFTKTNGNESWD